MAGPALPTNRTTASTIAEHVSDHNAAHNVVNKIDKDASPSNGQVLKWNGSVYVPASYSDGPTDFNVRDYGATGNGTTDDSAAFTAAHAAARTAIAANSGASGEANSRGRVRIIIPAGAYKIVTPEALMPATSGTRTAGLTYVGDGPGLTEIVFQPVAGGSKLMRNNDVWLGVFWSGISFLSKTAGSICLHSTSTGGAQNYRFTDCYWGGLWNYGIGLDGTNNNSEFHFDRPWVGGTYTTAFFWSGMTAATSAQDQFLNYSFVEPSVFMNGSTFLRFDYGGNIRVYGGNYIINDGATLYDLRDQNHNSGVENFVQYGGRCEVHNSTDKVMVNGWGRGTVAFYDWTEDSQVTFISQTTVAHSHLSVGDVGGPAIGYTRCQLSGRHEYGYGGSNHNHERSVVYDQCETEDEPHNFIVYTDTGSGQQGGKTAVEFRGRHKTRLYGPSRVSDQRLSWASAVSAMPERRAASFRTNGGGLPSNTPSVASVDLWLPMNAVVTAIRWYAGSVTGATNTNWQYDVKTSEGSPTTLGSVSGGGSVQWQTGWNEVDTVNNFVCNSDVKRHLVLSATNVTGDRTTTAGWVLVEYLA